MPKTTGVAAELLEGSGQHERARTIPGAFFYTYYMDAEQQRIDDIGIVHSCPCGCGLLSGVSLKEFPMSKLPKWTISGPREAPTLNPSVGIFAQGKNTRSAEVEADGYHWHGYLRAGVWESV